MKSYKLLNLLIVLTLTVPSVLPDPSISRSAPSEYSNASPAMLDIAAPIDGISSNRAENLPRVEPVQVINDIPTAPTQTTEQSDIVGPPGSGSFGTQVVALPNGNIVITDPYYDEGATANVGAVYLYNGTTLALISKLTGSAANDRVGSGGVTALSNGDFVISSSGWDNGAVVDAGAATWASKTTGINGVVSSANSLVGSSTSDGVGSSITALNNGNYVVISSSWNNGAATDAGAVTWGSGTAGVKGIVSSSNSLVGGAANNRVGVGGIDVLANGNYVVNSYLWDNGATADVGAVTWGSGAAGVKGVVSSSNSLVGSTAGDEVGHYGVTPLTNGNYVVSSIFWSNGATDNAGAATWGNGTTGITGIVSSVNSLVGSSSGDEVGYGIIALSNGNYIVRTPYWDNGSTTGVGAVTWGSGTSGVKGVISSANSLIGSTTGDSVGSTVIALNNGNYVVGSPSWDNGVITNTGAATWGNGTTGKTGVVLSSNSLVGGTANDQVGRAITALSNGHYIVQSPYWDNGTIVNTGAATWSSGNPGITGLVSATNSLVGSTANDQVGYHGVVALNNGNYVVRSSYWDNGSIAEAGAVTWGDGTTGITGNVSVANSLVGSSYGDNIGYDSVALSNGDYVVSSYAWDYMWDNSTIKDAGAVTWGDGTTGINGSISSANSLVGSTVYDSIGSAITALSSGDYAIKNQSWDNEDISDAGSMTWGNGTKGETGPIWAKNSVLGETVNGGSYLNFSYDSFNNQVVVGRPQDNIASLLRRQFSAEYIAVNGLSLGLTNTSYTFTASLNPTFTLPVSFTWYATDQLPVVHNSGPERADSFAFNWDTPGTKTITVTATNAVSTVSDTYSFAVYSQTCWARVNDEPTIYANVQAAIDAASAGDTVKVAGTCDGVTNRNGIYHVAYIDESITVQGGYTVTNWVDPDPVANPTTLDVSGMGRVIYVAPGITTTIDGLIIIGGSGVETGGGIRIEQATAIISGCQITGNSVGYPEPFPMLPAAGGGIYINNSQVTLIGNIIDYNHAYGGFVAGPNSPTTGGMSDGGGIAIYGSFVTMIDNTILGNGVDTFGMGTGSGGGLYSEYSSLTLTGNIFTNNISDYGGGIYFFSSDATIANNTISSNSSNVQGGGLLLENNSNVIADANLVMNNTAGYNGAGGVSVLNSDATLTNNIITDNSASTKGNGLYISGSTVDLLHNTLARNYGGSGEGIYVDSGTASTVFLTNTILVSHTVGMGIAAGNTVTVDGILWYNTPTPISKDPAATLNIDHQVYEDPAFLADGYHLTEASAAIDQGIPTTVTTDLDGQPRLQGPAPDLGADEWSVRVISIRGVVFDDLSGNGIQDSGEAGLTGVLITLQNGVSYTTTTGTDGAYSFANVPTGVYTVIETDLPGYSSVTSNAVPVSVITDGQAVINFADRRVGTVSGIVFDDINGNGRLDDGETGISGVLVHMTNGGIYSTTTALDGTYVFNDVTPGAITIWEIDPAGYFSLTPNALTVFVASGGSASAIFADQPAGTVGGTVFVDLNGNGTQDTSERGIGGVTVSLVNSGTQTATTTALDGTYAFTNVAPGTYVVWEADFAGYSSTTLNYRVIAITSGGSATASFGNQPVGMVSGVVYNDWNGNGVQDAGEPGLSDVTVSLINSQTHTTLTGIDGSYVFTDVVPGPYLVRELDPQGFASTNVNAVQVSVPAGGSATANFGDQIAGAISGMVFNDLDGNGIYDMNEPGVGGVLIILQGAGMLITTTTTGDGGFAFTGLTPGNYLVRETDPAGFASTNLNLVWVSLASGGSASVRFGDQRAGSINGLIFQDADLDGRFDNGEVGIGGVVISLYRQGSFLASTVTSGDGHYAFTNLLAGQYRICATTPEGFVPTASPCREVTLKRGGSVGTSMGFLPVGSVSGFVFNDWDGNGTRGLTEPGLGSVLLELKHGNTVITSTTSGNGAYAFLFVPPGAYQLCATAPDGFVDTTASCQQVLLQEGSSVTADFGYVEQNTIGGMVFYDVNGNGIPNIGEMGIGGVDVELHDTSGMLISTTVTTGDGIYQFRQIASGNYDVRMITPEGFNNTAPPEERIHLRGEGFVVINYGLQSVGSISGIAFEDLNGNGIQDLGEPGIGGATVVLSGTTILTATTSANGTYIFNVGAGQYTVSVIPPDGCFVTTPGLIHVLVDPNGNGNANFGHIRLGTVSGTVYNDINGDGRQEMGEPGIGGVEVAIWRGNAKYLTTTTNVDGSYLFVNLLPGGYTVIETDPPGYTSVTPNEVFVVLGQYRAATVNFGDRAVGVISGIVFDDRNGNGIQDIDENGIGGVRVELVSITTTLVVTTSGDGSYLFVALPGNYWVYETDPQGYVSTTPNLAFVAVTVGGSASVNFGDMPIGMIIGVVFNDLDSDGVQDASEMGLGGVEIELNGAVVITTTTTGNGTYRFSNIISGTYSLIETDPPGYVSTTPNYRLVAVSPGGSATADFGDQPVGLVSGIVYNDCNGNGLQDEGENGISGVLITLSGYSNITTTTAGNGTYLFQGITSDKYAVIETDLPGYVSSTPNDYVVFVAAGGSAIANFGDRQMGTVSGVVFYDGDGNGQQDAGEDGIGGVVIQLVSSGSTLTTTTIGNGSYQFNLVSPGNYTVIETDLPGYVSSTPNSVDIYVASDGAAQANFGDLQMGTVSGVVWYDYNGNGTQEPGEYGLGNKRVELIGVTTRVITTTGDGSYIFTAVDPGSYTVHIQTIDGMVNTTPGTQQVWVGANGSASANFGFQPRGSIVGTVYYDINGDGVKDLSEHGISGVQVQLLNSYDELVGVIVTTGDGSFEFRDLIPDRYTVHEIDPNGFVSSTPNSVIVGMADGGSYYVEFGDVEPATIRGMVYNDRNANRKRDSGEAGIDSVTISLYQEQTLLDIQETRDGGLFAFTGLLPGTYTVRETDLPGYVSSTSNNVTVRVPANGSVGVSFGDLIPGRVNGVAFYDTNGNGVQQSGENGLGELPIRLQSQDGAINRLVSTDIRGYYEFPSLMPGTYIVTGPTLPGLSHTTPPRVTVFVSAAGSAAVNFGYVEGTISGQVSALLKQRTHLPGWVYNYPMDNTLLRNVPIQLLNANGVVIRQTITDNNGNYSFRNVPIRQYYSVRMLKPPYGESTWWHPQGWDPWEDPKTSFYLYTRTIINFRVQYDPCILGSVYQDLNLDGVHNEGEPLLSSVHIYLKDSSGTVIREMDTDEAGDYLFLDVAIGTYLVEVVPPNGWAVVTESPASVALVKPTQGVNIAFGLMPVSGSGSLPWEAPSSGLGILVGQVLDDNGQGIPGVKITVLDGQGNPAGQGATIISGDFLIEDLPAGALTVIAATPPGYASLTPNTRAAFVNAGQSTAANFLYTALSNSVSGYLYQDDNGNGQRDPDDMGIGGVAVELQQDGIVLETITTTVNGFYAFPKVDGVYTVAIPDAPERLPTTPGSVNGWGLERIDFGVRFVISPTLSSAVIAGRVYNDINGNGLLEAGERPVGTALVSLYDLTGVLVMTDTTTGNGDYSFLDLPLAAYQVAASVETGFLATTPTTVTVWAPDHGTAQVDFGRRYVGMDDGIGIVAGRFFQDLNGDQSFQPGEPPAAGVTVYLIEGGNIVAESVTTVNGAYQFEVPQGDYEISPLLPSGFARTATNPLKVHVSGQQVTSVQIGLRRNGTISGTAFFDLDSDEHQNSAERSVGGITLTLQSFDGSVVMTTVTSIDGQYLFDPVETDTYTLTLELPNGLVTTTPVQHQIVLNSNNSATAVFGLQVANSIGGFVFLDLNGDNALGHNETGLSGVQVSLMSTSESRVMTTTSGGQYQFLNVPPGVYTITETDPQGFVSLINTVVVTITTGGSGSASFADRQAGTFSGTVFYDANTDKVMEDHEPGFGGAQLLLLDAGAAVVATTTVQGNGAYAFTGLAPAAYTLVVLEPAGFAATTARQVPAVLSSNGSQAINFGLWLADDMRPSAVDDSYTTDEDAPLVVPAPGVLENDSDPQNDPLTVTSYLAPLSGTLTLQANGGFTYTPVLDWSGSITFPYTINDGGLTATAQVTITVISVNDPPAAQDAITQTDEDSSTSGTIVANDVDDTVLTYTLDAAPAYGNATVNGITGAWVYTPTNRPVTYLDPFAIIVADSHGLTDTATISVTVTADNDAPFLADDSGTTDEDTPFTTGNVLSNDFDPEGMLLTVGALDISNTIGLVTDNGNGTFGYDPNGQFEPLMAGEQAVDTFSYTASDGVMTATASVVITITGVTDDPTATPTPTDTPTFTPTPTVPTTTPSITPTPTVPTSTPSPTPTVPTSTPSSTPIPTVPTATPSITPTPTMPTATPSPSLTPSPTASATPTPPGTTTSTPSPVPTVTFTLTPTFTKTPTLTVTIITPSDTATPTSTYMPTPTTQAGSVIYLPLLAKQTP